MHTFAVNFKKSVIKSNTYIQQASGNTTFRNKITNTPSKITKHF